MAKSKGLRKLRKQINKNQPFISDSRLPDLAKVLTAQINRSCYLLDLAAEEDDFGPVEKAIFQTTEELSETVLASWKAEDALYDLIQVCRQRNDELGERLTWSENWYLDQNPFLISKFLNFP